MSFVKQEDSKSRQASISLRQATPISVTSADDVAESSAAAAMKSPVTEPTLGGDVEMGDAAPNDALYNLGRRGRKLIQGIHKLEALGISAAVRSLPKVVVIGDQSAGKSSIIEAVCDVTLPRSEGTCTRCPFLLTTTATQDNNQTWCCTIKLVYKYAYTPGRSGHDDDFVGWHTYAQPEIFTFATVTKKADLELMLRRAQVAMLNPANSWVNYVHMPANEIDQATHRVDFSPNVISLEIMAPGLLDLSFYDLPGAINVLSNEEDDFLSEFIQKLIELYVKDEQTLVVIATPANQDAETGTSMRYLRQCKATGRATGVITKPDLVQLTPNRLHAWTKMLNGEDFRLGGGWYITKSLSQAQLNGIRPSYHVARQQEAEFFSGPPWSTTLDAYKDRFGVTNLQDAISMKHLEHIRASLPSIIDSVRGRIENVQQKLKNYPQKEPSPGLVIVREIDKVVRAVEAQCSFEVRQSKFLASQKANVARLFAQLKQAAPKVTFKTPGYETPAFTVSDDDEVLETPSKRVKVNNVRAASVTPRRGTPASSANRTPVMAGRKRNANALLDQTEDTIPVKTFDLGVVKQRFDNSPITSIPDEADKRITHDLMRESMDVFSTLTQRALKEFEVLVTEMLDSCLAEALHARHDTMLGRQTAEIMHSLAKEIFAKESDAIHHQVSCMTKRPITHSTKWFRMRKSEHERMLVQGRDEARILEHFETLESRGVKVPTGIEERKKKLGDEAWIANNIRSPAFSRELRELAMPLTFYELASGHLVDLVDRNLDYSIYELGDRLKTQLIDGLRPDDPDHAAYLLAEDPQREERRKELEEEMTKLEQALDELEGLSDPTA